MSLRALAIRYSHHPAAGGARLKHLQQRQKRKVFEMSKITYKNYKITRARFVSVCGRVSENTSGPLVSTADPSSPCVLSKPAERFQHRCPTLGCSLARPLLSLSSLKRRTCTCAAAGARHQKIYIYIYIMMKEGLSVCQWLAHFFWGSNYHDTWSYVLVLDKSQMFCWPDFSTQHRKCLKQSALFEIPAPQCTVLNCSCDMLFEDEAWGSDSASSEILCCHAWILLTNQKGIR